MDGCDAIIIGAGHNGLACACYLAAGGLDVLVLEEYGAVGGMTLTEEPTLPGFRSDIHASGYQLANLSPTPGELRLERFGLELIDSELAWAHAFSDGGCIAVGGDLERSVRSVAAYSAADAETFRALIERYRSEREAIIASFFSAPRPFAESAAEMATTEGGMDRYRAGLQSMRSWCDESFEAEQTKCLFGAFAPFVGHGPDDAGGGEIAWLFASVLQAEGNKLVRGGMNELTRAMAARLESLGGRVRTGARVERILVDSGAATAVRLEGGEEIAARRLVASSADPAQLVLRLLGEKVVGAAVADGARRIEWGDSVLVIYLALDGPVEYAAGPDAGAAPHVHLTEPSLAALATPIDESRDGRLPAAPTIVAWNDATIDPTRAPEGRDLKKLVVLGVPYEIRGDATGEVGVGGWDEVRERYGDYLLAMIEERYLPGIRERVIGRSIHSPLDIERKLSSAVRGTIPHGAMVPYQSGPMRPLPQLADYRTPVSNVYLCGSGSHPGAGVSMAAGRNAAVEIHRDLGLDFATTVATASA
jgi:phytoene dehydrogenase-like protein